MERLHNGRLVGPAGRMVAVEIEIEGGRIRRQVLFGDFVTLAGQLGLSLPH